MMKEKTKKIINICGAIGIACAFIIGACNSVVKNTTPIKAKANNDNKIVLNNLIENDNRYLLPYETMEFIKTQNNNVPYELSTLNDRDYVPVVYVFPFENNYDVGLFFRNLSYSNYNCYTKVRLLTNNDDGIDETIVFNTLEYVQGGESIIIDFYDTGGDVTGYEFEDYSYSGIAYLILGVSVRNNSIYQPLAYNLISNAYVYNVDSYGGMFEADYRNINNVASDGSNQNYLTYNIYPRVTLPRDLKTYTYYLGNKAWYLRLPYLYCEYNGENGMRYYINDEETTENDFTNVSISPNGKYYSIQIDEYSILTNEQTNREYVAHNFGRDYNTIDFIPTLENVLFYKYQGFKSYGNNGALANNMPNTYFALRDFEYLLPILGSATTLTLNLYLNYNGVYYDSITGIVYYYDGGFTKSYYMLNDFDNFTLYEAEAVYRSNGPMDVTYETDLTNYVINVAEQVYTDDVYSFISLYTSFEVDKNTIFTNPITNITTSTDFGGGNGVFDLFGSAFNGIYSAFNVMVFPGVTLWALLMVPLVGVILLFIIKLFKR